MTDYRNYNPRQSSLEAARSLLTAAANAAMASGAPAPRPSCPLSTWRFPPIPRTVTWPPTWPWWAPGPSTRHPVRSPRP